MSHPISLLLKMNRDLPSLDNSEGSTPRHMELQGQNEITITDRNVVVQVTSINKKQWAPKLDKSQKLVLNNEKSAVPSRKFNTFNRTKSLKNRHGNVLAVPKDIRVRDSSCAQMPGSHPTKCEISVPIEFLKEANAELNTYDSGRIRLIELNRDGDVSVIVNNKRTRSEVSPLSLAGLKTSRTDSECESMRSSDDGLSVAGTKSTEKQEHRCDADMHAFAREHGQLFGKTEQSQKAVLLAPSKEIRFYQEKERQLKLVSLAS